MIPIMQAASRTTTSAIPTPVIRIKPSKGWTALKLQDLWVYRELLYFLTLRDIKVRYKQTALGAAWAIIQPVSTMLIFSLIFGRLAKMPSDKFPYPLFSFSALVPWTFFATSMAMSANSLVGNANLITKIYFPRLTVPVATSLAGIVDLLLAFVVLLGMMFYYHVAISMRLFTIPLFILLALITSLGTGLWLSALNVEFRDIRYVVPFLTQFWFYATPITYPSSLIHEPWRTLYGLNPMAGVVEGFRWALLGDQSPGPMLIASSGTALLLLITGALYFRRMEKTFADVV
jgi:lipopolysaccharide transport system permease protein